MLLGVQFTDTINLSGVIIILIASLYGLYRIAVGAHLRTTNEIQSRTITALEADNEEKDRQLARREAKIESQTTRLNELGAEKDAAVAAATAHEATIATQREQIDSMPKYQDFMDYTTKMMEHVDSAARSRQEEFMSVVVGKLQTHDEHVAAIAEAAETKALERHEAAIAIDREILEALRGLNGGSE